MRDATPKEIQDIMEGKEYKFDGLLYNPDRKSFNPVVEKEGKVEIIGNVTVDIDATIVGAE